jgi:ABC-type nitrate/sulfonate/bicarbonate transport system substrate-binding protein
MIVLAIFACITFVVSVLFFLIKRDVGSNEGYIDQEIVIVSDYRYANVVFNVMQQKKILERHLPQGVGVKWIQMSGYENKRDAVAAGQVDFMSSSRDAMIPAMENGYPLVLISSGTRSGMALYSNNDAIQTEKDLIKAKKILVKSAAGTPEIVMQLIAERNFGDKHALDGKYTALGLGYPEMLELVSITQEYDAVELMFPWDLKAESKGLHIVCDMTEILEEYWFFSDVYSSEKWVRENQALLDIFLVAEQEAVDFINESPTETAYMLAELYDIDSESIVHEIELYPPSIKVINYNKTAMILHDLGLLEREPKKFEELFNYGQIPK